MFATVNTKYYLNLSLNHNYMKAIHIDKSSKKTIIDSFESIAKDLILNKQIAVNDSRYSFIDIEFYYWHDNHQDGYAKSIKHERPLGDFEIHKYGLDISLGNNENDLGGILIRGLYDLANKSVIPKPHVIKTLYNQLVQGNNRFELIDERSGWKEIFKTKRQNLGKTNNRNKKEFVDSLYRFLAKDEKIFTSYPDKENIFKYSDLSDIEIEKILGYKLTR